MSNPVSPYSVVDTLQFVTSSGVTWKDVVADAAEAVNTQMKTLSQQLAGFSPIVTQASASLSSIAAAMPSFPTPVVLGTGEGANFRPYLRQGPGRFPRAGGCFMEIASNIADTAQWSDTPGEVDLTLTGLGIRLNDTLRDPERQLLLPIAPRLIGTGGDLTYLKAGAWFYAAQRLTWEHSAVGAWQEELADARKAWAVGKLQDTLSCSVGLVYCVLEGRPMVERVPVYARLVDLLNEELGRTPLTLERVPASTWERMHRVMFGLVA